MSAALSDTSNQQFTTGQIVRAGLIAAIAASVANVLIYLIAQAIDAIPDDLPVDAEMLGVPAVIVACVLTIAVATIAMLLFNRFSQNPVRNFVILSIIVFLTSLSGPFSISGASASLVTTLLLMHIVATAIVLYVFTRFVGR